MSSGSRFGFTCHPALACFNRCCRRPTVILKPYDLIRLRRRLGISSTDFLERFTVRLLEEQSRLPLVLLDIAGAEGGGCPFLEAGGCGVYEDRPGACRLFPVIQGSSLEEDGVRDAYFVKSLDFCQGFGAGEEWTLSRWQADQGLEVYERLNRGWVDIMVTAGARRPAMDSRSQALFSLAAYDLDKFRRFVFNPPLLELFEIPGEVAAALRESDEALLQFGYSYLKMVLRLEDAEQMKAAMRVRPETLELGEK